MTDRKSFEAEIIRWLGGIADHTDNDVEHDLLHALMHSIEEGEYIDEPVAIDPNWTPPPAGAECPF